MTSIYMKIDQYSARIPNEDQAILSKRLDQEFKLTEFIKQCYNDNKDLYILNQNEKLILADKSIYIGIIKLESRLQDIDSKFLPFDNIDLDEKERNEKMREHRVRIKYFRQKEKQISQKLLHNQNTFGFFLYDFNSYEIITIPIRISFDIEVSSKFGYVISAAFLFDILLSFNTTIYKNGNIDYSYRIITLEYLKLWFWIDIIASFPYDLVFTLSLTGDAEDEISTSHTNLRKVLKSQGFQNSLDSQKLAKLKAIVDKIEEYFSDSSIIQTIAIFFQLSAFVLFWSHWLGCIFHFIAQNEDISYNWLTIYGIYDQSWEVRYANSVYWAVTTMITVGYGDLSPYTPLERVFGVFFLMIANKNLLGEIIFFGYNERTVFLYQKDRISLIYYKRFTQIFLFINLQNKLLQINFQKIEKNSFLLILRLIRINFIQIYTVINVIYQGMQQKIVLLYTLLLIYMFIRRQRQDASKQL